MVRELEPLKEVQKIDGLRYTPKGNTIIGRVQVKPENVTESGLYYVTQFGHEDERPSVVEVVAVGPGEYTKKGAVAHTGVTLGCKLHIKQFGGYNYVEEDGFLYVFIDGMSKHVYAMEV